MSKNTKRTKKSKAGEEDRDFFLFPTNEDIQEVEDQLEIKFKTQRLDSDFSVYNQFSDFN